MKKRATKKKRRFSSRPAKFQVPKDIVLDYKEYETLKKFLTDRGKLVSRRISGLTAKQQRTLTVAVKRARYLGLLSVGSAKRK